MEVIREDTLLDRIAAGTGRARADEPPVQILPVVRRYQREAALLRLAVPDEPAARRIRQATGPLGRAVGLDTLIARILEGALELTAADFGNVQLLDRGSGALEIAAHAGFETEFLDYFAIVDDDGSACGRAARLCAQTVISDVERDPDFRPHREIAAAAGFRAVQSTPLTDRTGALIGMLSTHYRRPGRPPERALHSVRVYARLAGEALAQALGANPLVDVAVDVDADEGAANGVGSAVSAAPEASVLRSDQLEREDEALIQLAERAIHRIFSASLNLAEVQGAMGNPQLRARVAAAVAELDETVKEIQAAAIAGLHE